MLLHTAWSPCCFVKARENVDRGLTVGIDTDLCRYAEEMRSVRLKRNRERDLETYNLAFAAIDEDGSGVRFPIPPFSSSCPTPLLSGCGCAPDFF